MIASEPLKSMVSPQNARHPITMNLINIVVPESYLIACVSSRYYGIRLIIANIFQVDDFLNFVS